MYFPQGRKKDAIRGNISCHLKDYGVLFQTTARLKHVSVVKESNCFHENPCSNETGETPNNT